MIRCLARMAKKSNRLDVFEHLRQIARAGTTGESVIYHSYILPVCVEATSPELGGLQTSKPTSVIAWDCCGPLSVVSKFWWSCFKHQSQQQEQKSKEELTMLRTNSSGIDKITIIFLYFPCGILVGLNTLLSVQLLRHKSLQLT